jgi:hypothetical protein
MMHDKLKKLIEKKKAKSEGLSDSHAKAKGSVLKELIGDMASEMGGKLKKVTVASPSKKGLEKGLDKAKEMMGSLPSDSEMEDMSHEAEGGHEEESEYGKEAEGSPEALKAKIKELEAKLKEMEGEEEAEGEDSEESEE